jgi:hypothetical protein
MASNTLGDYGSDDTRTTLCNLVNRNKVFKILSFEPVRYQWDLTVSQLGTVIICRGVGVDLKLCELENLT